MAYTLLQVQLENNIAWLTLNRPEKLNALTPLLIQEWRSALLELSKNDQCRVIVVSGAGKAWSAGVDLSVFQEIKVEPGYDMHKDGMELMQLLETIPQVTIAMVNGYCFTGAMEIMMAFDLIVAAEEAKIGDTHSKWGILPKWGMTQRLLQQVGIRKAKELSFTAKPVSGKEAERIGLINKAVPLAELKPTVTRLAEEIIQNSAQTITAIKELYQYGSQHTLEEGLQYELDFQMDLTDKTDTLKNFKNKLEE